MSKADRKFVFTCWNCGKEYKDVPLISDYKCVCGGYVVSPSGKVQGRWVVDESQAYGNDCPNGKCEM